MNIETMRFGWRFWRRFRPDWRRAKMKAMARKIGKHLDYINDTIQGGAEVIGDIKYSIKA